MNPIFWIDMLIIFIIAAMSPTIWVFTLLGVTKLFIWTATKLLVPTQKS